MPTLNIIQRQQIVEFAAKGIPHWQIAEYVNCHIRSVPNVIEHLAFSPDLNPIENLFAHLVKKVKHPKAFKNANAVWKAVNKAWNKDLKNDTKTLQNLMTSIKKRYTDVIKYRGGHTSY